MKDESNSVIQKNEKVSSFNHDIYQYLKKGTYYTKMYDYPNAIKYFKKVIDTNTEDTSIYYSIAYNLSEINKDHRYKIMDDFFMQSNPYYLFLAGIYYCLEEDVNGAEYYLKKFIIKKPESKLKLEANILINNIHETILFQNNLDYLKLTYSYADKIDTVREQLRVKFKSSFIQTTMNEYLYQMDDYMVSNVIFLYGILGKNNIAEEALRHFIKSSFIKEKHIELALLSLKKMEAEEPYEVMINDGIYQVTLKSYMKRHEDIEKLCNYWNDILTLVTHNMKVSNKYGEDSIKKVKSLWAKLVNSIYPDLPKLSHMSKKAWAAGLELTIIEEKCIKISSKRLALIYNVPILKIINKFNYIKKTVRF